MDFTMQIHLTDDCTVRCPYCYIHQCKGNSLTFDMFLKQYNNRKKIYSGFYETNYRQPFVDKYNVCFFGGEPTLNTEVMYQIADYMKAEGTANFFTVITNGTLLTKEMVKDLEAHDISYNVSFDGLWQKQIPYNKEYKPANETYFETIENLISSGIVNKASKVMMSPSNIDTLIENYEYFVNKLGEYSPDFSFVKDDIWSDFDLEKFDIRMKEFVEYLIRKTKETGKIHSVGFLTLFLADTILSKKYDRDFQCYAGTTGCCFTPTGIVYPCSRWYTNKKMPLYNANTDEIYSETYDFFKANYSTYSWEECKACVLNKKCHFGCHYSEAEYHGFKKMAPVPCVCKATKIMYKYSCYYYASLKNDVDLIGHIKKLYNLGGF